MSDLENAVYTVKSLEQYYNIKIRFATHQLNTKKITSAEAKKIYDTAIEGLKKMNGNTLERYSLIAAGYRRFYEISGDVVAHLLESTRYYRMAYEHGLKTAGYIDFYPYFNWLHFAILLTGAEGNHDFLKLPGDGDRAGLDKKALDYAILSDSLEPAFFKKTAPASAYLANLLLADNVNDIEKYSKLITDKFFDSWNREGNANDRNSFVNYLGSIISLLDKLAPAAITLVQDKIGFLNQIIRLIRKCVV